MTNNIQQVYTNHSGDDERQNRKSDGQSVADVQFHNSPLWQYDMEYRPGINLTLDPDHAAVRLDDAFYDR